MKVFHLSTSTLVVARKYNFCSTDFVTFAIQDHAQKEYQYLFVLKHSFNSQASLLISAKNQSISTTDGNKWGPSITKHGK